ncbi:MAG: cation diffusion facilitator family transporter [Chitinophagales bacterium]
MSVAKQNLEVQKKLTAVIVVLFIIKLVAWYLTNSVAILTDALEYTINVIAGLIGLYSLYLSSKPRDQDHPYGHGRVEFISAAVEGTLMIVSAFIIIYEAINNLKHPHTIEKLDFGILLVLLTAVINYAVGLYAVKRGSQNNSLPLMAAGKHMQSDTFATVGILIGLSLIYLFHIAWIDSAVALIFAFIIIIAGYKILRQSVAGIMDETDNELLEKVIKVLNENRKQNWIDLHNLRIIKYGSILHLDCHITIPWYLNIHEGHDEVKALEDLVRQHFGDSVELFVHTDGCLDFSCKICTKTDCDKRQHDFIKKIEWNVENISSNTKHKAEL